MTRCAGVSRCCTKANQLDECTINGPTNAVFYSIDNSLTKLNSRDYALLKYHGVLLLTEFLPIANAEKMPALSVLFIWLVEDCANRNIDIALYPKLDASLPRLCD